MVRLRVGWAVVMMGGLSQAWAHGPGDLALPSVSTGTAPYKSFHGTACATPTALYTVPDGWEFIITMVGSTSHGSASVAGDWDSGTQLLKTGNWCSRERRLAVVGGVDPHREWAIACEAGAQLSIQTTPSSGCGYFAGIFVGSGGPHRAYFGNSVDRSVMTVDAGNPFGAHHIALHP